MMIHHVRILTFLLALFATSPAGAVPVKFFGQDPVPNPSNTVPAGGGSASARASFLSNLATVSNESFEGLASQSSPPAPNAPSQNYNLSFTGSLAAINAVATAAAGAIMNTNVSGVFATQGSRYLLARGSVSFNFGSTPVSAFGFYINDIETVSTVVLTLIPAGGGTPLNVPYGGVVNSGANSVPGNGQLNFIGFIDTEVAYERVTVSFPGTTTEGFGFDELVVGDVAQVTTTQETVTQAQIADEPGWRLLSAPVQGVTVNLLALQNLVQGIPAGNGVAQAQYPSAQSNFYTSYNGGDRFDYVSLASTGVQLTPGRGFWWYWYDLAIDPDNASFGGGTSESVALDNFALTALGTALTASVTESFADNTNGASGSGPNGNPTGPNGELLPADDDFYMVGNPFKDPFSVSSISVTGGTLQDAFFAWNAGNPNGTPPVDPSTVLNGPGSYEVLFATPTPGQQNYAAVWQGLMAEVTSPSAATIDFTFDIAGIDVNQTPPFHGKTASESYLSLYLDGTTESGAQVRDAAAWIRFRADAGTGWDRFDASKPMPPSAPFALIAPVGVRDGAAYQQAVRSLPMEAADVSVPVSFVSTEGGSFTLSWRGVDTFDGTRDLSLIDHLTRTAVDLASSASYAFTADASDWADRFEIRIGSAAVGTETGPAAAFVGRPWPNPAVGAAAMNIRLAESGQVYVSVFDAIGRLISRSDRGVLEAGVVHQIEIKTDALKSGVYVVRIDGGAEQTGRRLTVVR